jgi:hypothetical protein
VQVVDTEGVTLVERWIADDLQRPYDLQTSKGDPR